ncbi:hypothetical protein ASU33_20040 [Solirubrum puertoriconensis]|uniref:Methyltransferase domain-containing protein n=1 Tax=Solirubrum puertoriconensis TaxID=1751427 RepID=A0A9X0L5V8_SOLP1|nr:hypothetical protein ASU33_20040 [Solirubrum puertoriconensis]
MAIADLFVNRFGKPIPMQYIGVDIAPAMLDKARDFATDSTLFSASEFFFLVDFQEVLSLITERIVRSNEAILINASYLFASSSLIVDDLAAFVIQLHTRCPTSPIYFVYQNPVHEDKNAKYQEWKTHLPGLKVVHHAKEPVQYRTRRFGGTSEPETVRYELLTYGS